MLQVCSSFGTPSDAEVALITDESSDKGGKGRAHIARKGDILLPVAVLHYNVITCHTVYCMQSA